MYLSESLFVYHKKFSKEKVTLDDLSQVPSENDKGFLINQLINSGIYKINNSHLFELSLTDLAREYHKLQYKESQSSNIKNND